MNETSDDITDGGDDKQIDAIVIDDDKALVRIIQGKFIQSGTVDAEPLREVLSAWIQTKDLARLQIVANPKLKRKLAELAAALDDDYDVSFELITTGALTEAALHDLEAFQQELAKLSEKENFDATIHVMDGDELRRRYDYAIESDNPSINYTLNLAGSKYMFHEIAGTPVLIAAVPLKECIRLPIIKDGTLFQKKRSAKPRIEQRGYPRDDHRRQAVGFLFLPQRHHGAVQQDAARRRHTHAAGPHHRQRLPIAEYNSVV